MRALALGMALVAMGCGTAASADAGADAAARDAGPDALVRDGSTDAARADAASDASPVPDAAESDGGETGDAASALDAAAEDAALDAGASDAGPSDAGPSDAGIVRTSDPPTHPAAPPIAPFTECTVTTSTDTISGAEHRTPCDPIPYPAYPPSAGPHYSIWASFRTYAAPVPWGFLVHDLEHGAVVLAYHCENDADCDPVRAELASIVNDMGVDPVCRMEVNATRFILVPDPALPVPIAAVAWRNVYEATCLDPTSLRAFVTAHYGMGPESLCVPGRDEPDGGAWCP